MPANGRWDLIRRLKGKPSSSTVVKSTLHNCFCIKVRVSQGTWALLFESQDNIRNLLYCLTLEDGTDNLSRNVGKNYHSALRNIPEERRSHLRRGGGLKSLITSDYLRKQN
jgi:hypothetical protein